MDDILKKQKIFFDEKKTFDIDYRIKYLRGLKKAIQDREVDIEKALFEDLRKSKSEAYMTEIGLIYDEIDNQIINIRKWAFVEKVSTPISMLPGTSFIEKEPLGNILIMVPWNYPILLAMVPLVGALAAGNTAVIRPSNKSEKSKEVIKEIVESTFPAEYVSVVTGSHETAEKLLESNFDLIFFTGSQGTGQMVMEKAAKNLTPVILELGGKNPVIIDKSCDISLVAKRIAFGKVMNSGQTCTAPDYVMMPKSFYGDFVSSYKHALDEFFPELDYEKKYEQMGKIIDVKQFQDKKSLLDGANIVLGGKVFDDELKIEPTLVDMGSISDHIEGGKYFGENEKSLMKEEIFAPILPVITYEDLDMVITYIKSKDKPLALYLFTKDKNIEKKILNEISFGGGCINDTLVQLANCNMPFGGVGSSGIGKYHGKYSFDSFSHFKSIYKNSTFIDIKTRYLPYTDKKFNLIKKLLK